MSFDGKISANVCTCCGQQIPSAGRLTLRVDEKVLQLCNAAFEDADGAGAEHVDVAHLLMCFARDETTRSLFHHFGFDADQMRETARQWLARQDATERRGW